MSVTFDFTGKVCLITGAASSVGSATAELFARSRAQLVLADNKEEVLKQICKECDEVSPIGCTALPLVTDMTKEEDMKQLVSKTMTTFGKVDVLVNNGSADVTEINVTDQEFMSTFRSVFETNLSSAVYMTHLCAEHLSRSDGNIVNVSTNYSLQAVEGYSPYTIAKNALDMFTRCMAIELGPLGIRVNTINCGWIKTVPIKHLAGSPNDHSDHLVLDMYGQCFPVGRMGLPLDIANAILFLASDASAFTSGTALVVDGGQLAVGNKLKTNSLDEPEMGSSAGYDLTTQFDDLFY